MKIPRPVKWIIRICLGLLALFLIAIVGLTILAFALFPRETHSLRKYPALRAQWDKELIKYFPESIPPSATLKTFSHCPAFMQGGAHIQLRLALPQSEISRLDSQFRKVTTKSFFGGNCNDHMNQSNGMPTTSFYTGDGDRRRFPDDYEILIFDPVLTNRPPGFYWNHGRSHGVAISTNRNEIVYWAEHW